MTDYDPEAKRAASDWLAITDAGDAKASWAAASLLFKQAVTADDWARSLTAARGPLGNVISRELREGRAAHELPGAPDGDYVVFQFETQFEHKRQAIETVTPMKDSDGAWRVSGYYIR